MILIYEIRKEIEKRCLRELVTFFWGAIETTEKDAGDLPAEEERRKRGRMGLETNRVCR